MKDINRENNAMQNDNNSKGEHWKSKWTHPFALFIYLNVVLALILIGLGWMAKVLGWLPDRGI